MKLILSALAASALCACAAGPAVTADSRDGFDTVKGLYGGNEFSALSPEGKRSYEGDPAPASPAKPAPSPAPQPAAAAPSVAAAPAPAPAVTAVPAPVPTQIASAPPALAMAVPPSMTRIAIDPNAFAAVFGSGTTPVKPSAEQLMQLDSISLMAADAKRVQLQQAILACRRAGETCRLAIQ